MSQQTVARVMWIVPTALLLLSIHQVRVAHGVRQVLEHGVPAKAEVIDYERVDRADVTYGHVSLRVHSDRDTLVKERMSLPYTLLQRLADRDTLDVQVVRTNAEPRLVIVEVAQTQWKIAAIQSAMAALGSVLAAIGVWAWNRWLGRSAV